MSEEEKKAVEDRYFIKQMYQYKRSILQELLESEE